MKRLEECDSHWRLNYMQGNDWGIKPHKEEMICYTEEELQRKLDSLDYYTYDIWVEKVVLYEFNKSGIGMEE